MQVNFNVLNQEGAPALFEGNNLPLPGFLGRLFFSTQGQGIFADLEDSWFQVCAGVGQIIPTLQQVTDEGNSTTNKIELINNDSTIDALSIALNGSNTRGLAITSNEYDTTAIQIYQTANGNGITIEKYSGFGLQIYQTESSCIIASTADDCALFYSINGAAVVGNSNDGFGGIFNAYGIGNGIFASALEGNASIFKITPTSQNFAAVFSTNDILTTYPLISFQNQQTYTGLAVAAAEYLPIDINGTTHLIRLFAPI